MKVLITGAEGQVGRELQATAPAHYELILLAHRRNQSGQSGLDITDAAAVAACLQAQRPDLVVNAAAYTQVDEAEKEAKSAFAVNSSGAANLAIAALRQGMRLIHLSTDFVFDGSKITPYAPTDATGPLSVYGASKKEGEEKVYQATGGAALIMRSAWIYSRYGRNFVATILRLAKERDKLRIVSDQTGTPTWARSLARAVWAAASKPELTGIYHWTDGGEASWYEFAVAIRDEALALGLLSRSVPIEPIPTEAYPTPARRPRYSVLDCTATQRALSLTPAHWRSNLRAMMEELV